MLINFCYLRRFALKLSFKTYNSFLQLIKRMLLQEHDDISVGKLGKWRFQSAALNRKTRFDNQRMLL